MSQPTLLDKSPPFPSVSATLRNFHATLFLLRDWVSFQVPLRKVGKKNKPLEWNDDLPEITVLHASPMAHLGRLLQDMRSLRENWDELVREWDSHSTETMMNQHNRLVCTAVDILNRTNKTETDLAADSHSEVFRSRKRIADTIRNAQENGFPMMLMGPEGPLDPDQVLDQLEEEDEPEESEEEASDEE